MFGRVPAYRGLKIIYNKEYIKELICLMLVLQPPGYVFQNKAKQNPGVHTGSCLDVPQPTPASTSLCIGILVFYTFPDLCSPVMVFDTMDHNSIY